MAKARGNMRSKSMNMPNSNVHQLPKVYPVLSIARATIKGINGKPQQTR